MDLKWDDFNLPSCAQDSDKDAKRKFLEYPIIPGDDAWSGQVAQGTDRVVFQYVDDDTAAFCGIIRHPGKDGVNNHFQLCDDPRCGVHVIQVKFLIHYNHHHHHHHHHSKNPQPEPENSTIAPANNRDPNPKKISSTKKTKTTSVPTTGLMSPSKMI